MHIAALYDIHGNLPALEAVLADVSRAGIRRLLIGGDVVPGPMPQECLTLLWTTPIPTQFIRGNGERVVVAARGGGEVSSEVPQAFHEVIRWNGAQIDDRMADWMSTWPSTTRVTLDSAGDLLFCHATPRSDLEIFTRDTPEDRLVQLFADAGVATVVCGHTHMQFVRVVGQTRIVNAGSVGMSFQGPGAYWLEIGEEVRLRRTDYDRTAAAARIRATSYPQAEYFAAKHVLETPSEPAMLEAFAKAELGAR